MTTTSPSHQLLLSAEEEDVLAQSEGFGLLRDHLALHYREPFCEHHQNSLEGARWEIARDLLHACLVPLVEVYDLAAVLAARHARPAQRPEEVFTGAARSAYVWLQTFLSHQRNRDWCYTRGCPACVVISVLNTESTLRMLYVACLLSNVHYPFTIEGPTLPSFFFYLERLRSAVMQTPRFDDNLLDMLQIRADQIVTSIEDLMLQALELDRCGTRAPRFKSADEKYRIDVAVQRCREMSDDDGMSSCCEAPLPQAVL
ncbi:hypothetical protein K470DRAFT_253985 [Piedraia hortae CBS 480.64]|uniref:Uncharacterized protein n=1 Tax=Piedraia hortae CBS 480.64 TaxID=1314780 RepID=A0A6A7CB80_9PEZI|nr:hypothetical protein K470DRAFT_253985 [Piedraia hortae CBS 480.64]